MAGTFPITEARQELAVSPTRAVRTNIDTRTGAGAVGAAIGEALIAGAGELQKGSARRAAIELKRREMMDDNMSVIAKKMRDTATITFNTFKRTNPQETWEPERIKQTQEVANAITGLDFSPDALLLESLKSDAYSAVESARAFDDATKKLVEDTIEAQTQALVDAFRTGGAKEQLEAATRYRDNGANMGKDKVEVLNDIKAARVAGQKLREDDAINAVHAALEIAAATGRFDIAKELAKNPTITEVRQTTLRNAISTAEKARTVEINNTQTALIDKTTSDTIREYFGDALLVGTLNQRHEEGLIKDSEFKFMMQGLTETIPKNSDPFAAGIIRKAMGDFEAGAINRTEADNTVLEHYIKLDGPDRSKVVTDLEDVSTSIIGTAKTNAYSEGRGLMSVQFVGIKSSEELFALFALPGLSEEDKKRINRRWEAEIANRDLYERAVDDRFREMRKEGISDTSKYQGESLRILLEYQTRKRLGLEELEAEVRKEQQAIIAPATRQAAMPVDEMSTEQKQAELQRIRELRRLTK